MQTSVARQTFFRLSPTNLLSPLFYGGELLYALLIRNREDVSLQAAWRILRGLSQQEVADKLGISQSAVSQLEAKDSRPQKRTREKLAAIYGCKQEQISLYLPKEG